MTGPGDLGLPELPRTDPAGDDVPAADDAPAGTAAPAATDASGGGATTPALTRPSLRTFSLEGRRAAGLYLVGWLASLLGAATMFVVLLAQPSDLSGAVLLGAGTLLLTVGLVAGAGSQAVERQAAGTLRYRGPSPFILFGADVALTLFLDLLAIPLLQAAGVRSGTAVEALVGLLILNGSAIVLVAVLVVGSGSLSWREMGWPVRTTRILPLAGLARDLIEGMLLAVPVLFLTVGLGAVLIRIVGAAPPGPLPQAVSPADAVLNLVSGALVAPFGEELFYRGFATTAWVRGMGPRAGIVRGALLFAVAHVLTLSGTPATALIAFVTRLPIALALGWIFVRRGSVVSSFGMHAMFNAIPLVIVGLSLQG